MIYNFRVSLCLASWDITQALAEATQRQEDLERQGGSEVQRLQVPNSAELLKNQLAFEIEKKGQSIES